MSGVKRFNSGHHSNIIFIVFFFKLTTIIHEFLKLICFKVQVSIHWMQTQSVQSHTYVIYNFNSNSYRDAFQVIQQLQSMLRVQLQQNLPLHALVSQCIRGVRVKWHTRAVDILSVKALSIYIFLLLNVGCVFSCLAV